MLRCRTMTKERLKEILDRVLTWPAERQDELAQIALEISAELEGKDYHATSDELKAIDEGLEGGVASDAEVEAAFATFRRR